MKRCKCFLVLTFFCTIARAQIEEKLISQQKIALSHPNRSYTLDVSLTSGAIRVRGYDGKEILITIYRQYQLRRNAVELDSVVRNIYTITVTEKNNDITVRNDNIVHNTVVEFSIPNNVKLKLNTIQNAGIRVEGITGQMELSTEYAGIRLDNVSGSVVANTINGGIIASFTKVDPVVPMAFSTLNGGIKLTLPVTVKCNLRLKTEKGRVVSDFDIDYRQPLDRQDWRIGTINGGGSELMIKNISGNITLLKSPTN